MPPIYEPLAINCELLFSLAKQLDVDPKTQNDIDGILIESGESIFLNEYQREKYSFYYSRPGCKAVLEKKTITIPARFLSDGYRVRANVIDNGSTNTYDDWNIVEVHRSEDFDDYTVKLVSEEISKQEWSKNSRVVVEIIDNHIDETVDSMVFVVENYSKSIFGTSVSFKQVT